MFFSVPRRLGLLLAPIAAIAVFMAILLGAAPSARAAIAFPPPAQLTSDCNAAATLTPPFLQVVMNASGDEFAAWNCENAAGTAGIVQESVLPAGGAWSTPVTVSSEAPGGPVAVGIDGSGNGLLTWWDQVNPPPGGAVLAAAVVAPDGSVTSQTTLSTSPDVGVEPEVAVNPSGDAVVVWTDASEAPMAAEGSLSKGLGTPVPLDKGGSHVGTVAVAMDGGGDAAAAWCLVSGSCSSAISQSGGAFSSAAAFPSDGGSDDAGPMITMDPKGNVTLAWEKVGCNGCSTSAMYAAQEPLTGGFGSAQQISTTSNQIYDPVMASDASGDTVVAWVDIAVSGLPVEAATLQAGATSFQPWFQVGNDGNFGNIISAAVDDAGTATVTWTDQTVSCGCPPEPPSYSASFSTSPPPATGPIVRGASRLVSASSAPASVVTQLPPGATAESSASGLAGFIGVVWASASKSSKAVLASTGKQLRYQPDAQIKLGSDKSYLGLGVFNTTGSQQTRSTSVHPGHIATFDLKLVNAVLRSDSLALKGCASSPGFTVRYLLGSTDVTNQVTAGTYTTGTLAPAASQTLKLTIAVASTASAGTTTTCQVTASSNAAPTRKDRVKAKVKVG